MRNRGEALSSRLGQIMNAFLTPDPTSERRVCGTSHAHKIRALGSRMMMNDGACAHRTRGHLMSAFRNASFWTVNTTPPSRRFKLFFHSANRFRKATISVTERAISMDGIGQT